MFSLVRALPSTASAARACCSFALFGDFIGITARSDSSSPFMPDVRLTPSPAGLIRFRSVNDEVSRFSCMQFLGVRGVYDYVGPTPGSRNRRPPCCLPLLSTGSASQFLLFEAQYPAHRCPCPTLHPPPHDDRRMTRGQDGSLLLSCRTLSFPTACRFIPALSDSNKLPLFRCDCLSAHRSRSGSPHEPAESSPRRRSMGPSSCSQGAAEATPFQGQPARFPVFSGTPETHASIRCTPLGRPSAGTHPCAALGRCARPGVRGSSVKTSTPYRSAGLAMENAGGPVEAIRLTGADRRGSRFPTRTSHPHLRALRSYPFTTHPTSVTN
jgi:hypothetical protein